jgi:hypothetical protein
MAVADKTGLEDFLQVLERLALEAEAGKFVLQHSGHANWAKLLSDYRSLPANQKRVKQQLGGVRALLQRIPEPKVYGAEAVNEDTWQALAKALKFWFFAEPCD